MALLELDNTIGGASANCYNTLQQFNDYLAAVFPKPTVALNASQDDKHRALVAACADIDRRRYNGSRVTSTQARAFPRYSLINPDSVNADWTPDYAIAGNFDGLAYYAIDIIPDRVKVAECAIAQALLEGDYTPGKSGAVGDVMQFAADGVSFTFGKAAHGRDKTQWPEAAARALGPLLAGIAIAKNFQ